MTRKEIETDYTVVNGRIVNPGKFEGEAVYAPYFYEAYMDGCYTDEIGDNVVFEVEWFDRIAFPELEHATEVSLTIDDNGFVYVWISADNVLSE